MATPAGARTYRIVVEGTLDDSYAVLFEGMEVTSEAGLTAITGSVVDQAALSGYINQVQELGLELVSLGRVDPADSPTPAHALAPDSSPATADARSPETPTVTTGATL